MLNSIIIYHNNNNNNNNNKSGVELLEKQAEGVLCIKKPWPSMG